MHCACKGVTHEEHSISDSVAVQLQEELSHVEGQLEICMRKIVIFPIYLTLQLVGGNALMISFFAIDKIQG